MEQDGYHIRAKMRRAGVMVKDIAAICWVSHEFVSQVIHGVRPTQRIRQAISDAISAPISELWPDTKTDQSKDAA